MKLQELNAVLRLYESNFRNLHWNARGNDFNDSHKSISTEYYEMIGGTIDQVAEMSIMLGFEDIPNFAEVLEIVQNTEKNYVMVDAKTLYNRAKIIEISDIMLGDICELLSEVLQEEFMNDLMNAGIKSEFETILYNYTLQYRYINKRRMMSE